MPEQVRSALVGVVHGRFQVFHNDHLKYVLAAKAHCETLVIGITSPELGFSAVESAAPHRADPNFNPLTYYERMLMIISCLQHESLDLAAFHIVPFPIEQPERLVNYSPRDATYFMTIYDQWGEEKLRRLQDLGLSTHVLWRSLEKDICGTDVRKVVACGGNWRSLVPAGTAEYMERCEIEARIRRSLSRQET